MIEKKQIGIKIKKICKKYKVKLIVNDDPNLAKEISADGCHLGQSDMNIQRARKILRKKSLVLRVIIQKKRLNRQLKMGQIILRLVLFSDQKRKK